MMELRALCAQPACFITVCAHNLGDPISYRHPWKSWRHFSFDSGMAVRLMNLAVRSLDI